MQTIEVSETDYNRLLKRSRANGITLSAAVTELLDMYDGDIGEEDGWDVDLINKRTAEALRTTKKPHTLEEVFDGV